MGVHLYQYDLLSDSAVAVLRIDPDLAYQRLVVTGEGSHVGQISLAAVTPENILSTKIADTDEATAALSGLWLWHDWLDKSHTLSQGIETSTGSFWHAIMHRREGDFNNAKYWYGKCRNHPSMAEMARRGSQLVTASPASDHARAIIERGWDAYALVDFMESFYDAADDHPPLKLAQQLQRMEWEILMDHTLKAAAGRE